MRIFENRIKGIKKNKLKRLSVPHFGGFRRLNNMKKIKTNESRYASTLIEANLDPLVTIDLDGKITDMNEAKVTITGVDRDKLIGSSFYNYFTDIEKAKEVYKLLFANGSVKDFPLTFCSKSKKLTDVLLNGYVYKDSNESVLGAVLVARDIEKQKWATELQKANKKLAFQNEEKEKRAAELKIADKELVIQNAEKERREAATKELEAISYSLKLASQYARSLIEASLDPLFTINLQGKITDLNNASVKITGVSREHIIGTDFFDYFTEPEKAKEVYQDVFANGFVTDFPLTIRDGKLTDVLFNGSIYKDGRGNMQGVVVVARDITDQKKIETQLNEAIVFAEMATQIAEMAKSKAETSTLIAETAVKAKQQFLSNMSHEIRTPMNAIIGFTKVLLKSDLTAKQKEYLSAIKMSGDALIVLINDILDLAKVDAGKMVFEKIPFKMRLSISAMLHLFETKIQEKNLKLVVDYDKTIPEVLLGDPVRLHQIILNLLSNAVKFTAKGKIYVSIRLLSNNTDNAEVLFSIKDTGIGIPDEKMVKIFENFQQASSGTSRLYGGTGLGLAIVKQLVESQGGTIQVASKVNEGSTFSFTLRFQKTDEETFEEIIDEKLDDEIKNLKVLVVEDIPLNQLLMKTLLDDFGFERDIADNGKIAIEKLKTKDFDIILMDLQMPEMNGFEATDYIRNVMHSNIPIIALTADVTTVDLAKCKAVGMNDYIAKPVDERILYSKIIGLIKKTAVVDNRGKKEKVASEEKIIRCTDLGYLNNRTKSNPELMMEMISLYLEQTPMLIYVMKKSMEEKDWNSLHSAVHKMIPSFAIMGINSDFENMARKVQEYAGAMQQSDVIQEMVLQLDNICNQACKELQEEYNLIKSKK